MNFHGGNIYGYNKKLLDFSSNINPLGVPESFKSALSVGIDDFTKYPDIEYKELRQAIGEYLGIGSIDCIAVGNGAIELIYKAIQKSGKKKVIGLKPTFSEYSRAALMQNMSYVSIKAYDSEYEKINMKSILENADESSAIVICNPNNPTGTLLAKEQLICLARELAAKGSLLILDEAFMEFTEDYPANSMLDQVEKFHNLVIVKAATKFFGMPGIRLGYAISSNMSLLKAVKESMEPWNVNTAAVIAGTVVLRDRDYISKSRLWINTERIFMYNALSDCSNLKVYSSAANFHLVKILKEDMNAWQLKERLLEKGILIRTPEGFEGLSGQYVRLAIKSRGENILLLNALKEALI